MKRILWIAVIAAGLMCCSTSVFAEIDSITYTKGSGVMNINVSGTANEPKEKISFIVLKEGVSADEYKAASEIERVEMIDFPFETTADADKAWEFSFQLEGTDEDERFFRLRERSSSEIVVLPIYGADDAVDAINEAEESEIADMLEKYAPFFGYKNSEAYEVFASMPERNKEYVYSCLGSEDSFSDTEDIDEAFAEYTGMSFVAKALGADQLKENFDICADILDLNVTKYNKLNDKQKLIVCGKLIDEFENEVFTVKELQDELDSAVDSNKSDTKPSGSGGSGGGGGSGGSSGGGATSKTEFGAPADTSEFVKEEASLFTDIASVEWATESINELARLGVVNGKAEGIFAPDDTVTREEFVKMAVGALSALDENAECDFTDVDKNAWYYRYIATASATGLVKGMGDGSFGVGQAVSRQDIATILWNAVGEKLIADEGRAFADEAEISDYAKTAVSKLRGAGIIDGTGENEFRPLRSATRAEAAKLLYMTMLTIK